MEIANMKSRVNEKDYNREREIQNVQTNIQNATKELNSLRKKMGVNEMEQVKFLKEKIAETDKLNKSLLKEIKLLKRLEHHQGNKLVDISDPD